MDKINATQLAPSSATKLIHRSCFFIFTIDTTPIHHPAVLIPAPSRLNFSRGARVDIICAELRDLWPRVAGRCVYQQLLPRLSREMAAASILSFCPSHRIGIILGVAQVCQLADRYVGSLISNYLANASARQSSRPRMHEPVLFATVVPKDNFLGRLHEQLLMTPKHIARFNMHWCCECVC